MYAVIICATNENTAVHIANNKYDSHLSFNSWEGIMKILVDT